MLTGPASRSAVIASLIDAWQRHDAQAHGARFTVDATYITFVGTYHQGHADIVESHRTLFEKHLEGTRLAGEVLDIRFHGPDAAVVTVRGDTYKGSRPQELTRIQTYTLVREADGERRIAALPQHQAQVAAGGDLAQDRPGPGPGRFSTSTAD